MSVRLEDPETMYLQAYRKLMGDWILIAGDPDAIGLLEYNVYTPGTSKNADFEAVMTPSMVFYMGRKTPELRALLQLDNDNGGWASLTWLILTALPESNYRAETRHAINTLSRGTLLETVLKNLMYGVRTQ